MQKSEIIQVKIDKDRGNNRCNQKQSGIINIIEKNHQNTENGPAFSASRRILYFNCKNEMYV